ncbi:MAG: hypothetical protein AB2693_29560, partial [Candidatus Thiodiazotropha sp.]
GNILWWLESEDAGLGCFGGGFGWFGVFWGGLGCFHGPHQSWLSLPVFMPNVSTNNNSCRNHYSAF